MTDSTAPLSDAHFDAPTCHNCGAPRATAFCPACGQQRAERFRIATIASEAWDKVRVFDFATLRAIARTLVGPGTVAREFVLGARKKHVHPLKLLLIAIGVLLLVLARLRHLNPQVSEVMALAQSYAQWSFSLGIVAILAASCLTLWRRRGYNFTEHLVLAIYAHFLVICASTVNMLPTLFLRSPDFLAAHKLWSAWGMGAVEAAIVALAYAQFFALDWRRDRPRLLLAASAFVAIKWLLEQGFARLLVRAVMAQMG